MLVNRWKSIGRRLLAGLGLATTLIWAAPLTAEDEGQDEPARLEVKHVDDQGNVKVEVGPAPKSSMKLVPFPEDLESPPVKIPASKLTPKAPAVAPKAIAAKPLKPEGTSTFQPKFRTPAVQKAQHVEPVVEENTDAAESTSAATSGEVTAAVATSPADSAGPELTPSNEGAAVEPQPLPSAPASRVVAGPNHSPGKSLIEEAFAKSKTAASDAEYTEIIDLCRRANKEGLRKTHSAYSAQLSSWAYNRRGEVRATEKRDQEALADFEAAVELNGRSWRAVHNRGVSYAALGRVEQAMKDFDRTIELQQKYPNAYFNRGELLYGQGKYDEAAKDYTAAINLGAHEAVMYVSRGHAFYRMKRFGEALADYGKALEVEPNHAPALVNRGDTYADLGRFADAAADYRAAIQADGQFARGFQAAAWLMATCPDEHYRNEKLAVDAARKAIQLEGESFRNLETLAAAQASAGQFAEAKESQEKAIALAPRGDLVAAEKRMAMYQRDVAYREQSRGEMIAAKETRAQIAASERKLPFPVKRASANEPIDDGAPAGNPQARPAMQGQPMPSRSPQASRPGASRPPATRPWSNQPPVNPGAPPQDQGYYQDQAPPQQQRSAPRPRTRLFGGN